MTSWYLDASALVKRYVQEPGSDWLREGLASGSVPTLFTSRLTIVEVISAFARRIREGSLTQHEFVAARDAFRSDCMDEYQIMPPTLAVVDLACGLLQRHPLRAYDAIHLASALHAHRFLASQSSYELVFLSADNRLNQAAATEGLVTRDPGDMES